MPPSLPNQIVEPLPTPQPRSVATFTTLCKERFGVTFDSEEEATTVLTELLQVYYLLGGHLRRKHSIEELIEQRRKAKATRPTEP